MLAEVNLKSPWGNNSTGSDDMVDARDVEGRLNTHEAVCAERYSGINGRLKRIEGWFVSGIVGIVGLLTTIILKLF